MGEQIALKAPGHCHTLKIWDRISLGPDLFPAVEGPGPASRSPKFHQTTLSSGKEEQHKIEFMQTRNADADFCLHAFSNDRQYRKDPKLAVGTILT